MKKTVKTLISFFLALLMTFSFVSPAFAADGSSSSTSTTNTLAFQQQMNFSSLDVANETLSNPTSSMFRNLCKGPVSMVAKRAVKEITSLLIREDIQGLSKALVMLQDPATRAELEHKKLVQEMAASINEILESVARIENQLKDISDKMDKYATSEALKDATTSLNEITSKYQVVWKDYQAVVDAGKTLAEDEETYPEATRTDEQKLIISQDEKNLNVATSTFLNSIEEGGGL